MATNQRQSYVIVNMMPIMPTPFSIARFQVNNLCTSLLALRLLPIILRTSEKHHTSPRIVVVSSGVHYWAKLDNDVFESPNGLVKFGKKEFSEYAILFPL